MLLCGVSQVGAIGASSTWVTSGSIKCHGLATSSSSPYFRSSRPPRSGPSHLLQNPPPRSIPCFHRPSRSFPTAASHTNNWNWPARRVLPVVCPSRGSSCHHHHFRLPSSSTTTTTTTLLDAQEFFHNVCGPHSKRWQDSIHVHRV